MLHDVGVRRTESGDVYPDAESVSHGAGTATFSMPAQWRGRQLVAAGVRQ
jgi:hypothetical protein